MVMILLKHRYLFNHAYFSVFYPWMAPETIYLLVRNMLFMNEFNIIVHFRPFHMAKITFVSGSNAITFRHFRMALIAFITCL